MKNSLGEIRFHPQDLMSPMVPAHSALVLKLRLSEADRKEEAPWNKINATFGSSFHQCRIETSHTILPTSVSRTDLSDGLKLPWVLMHSNSTGFYKKEKTGHSAESLLLLKFLSQLKTCEVNVILHQ